MYHYEIRYQIESPHINTKCAGFLLQIEMPATKNLSEKRLPGGSVIAQRLILKGMV